MEHLLPLQDEPNDTRGALEPGSVRERVRSLLFRGIDDGSYVITSQNNAIIPVPTI
jgi:hypothetical protein